MNLRQKRKHYYHSYNKYIAYWSMNDVDYFPKVSKKQLRTLKSNYKTRLEYDFESVSRNYFYFETYIGAMPKFMREEKRKKGRAC